MQAKLAEALRTLLSAKSLTEVAPSPDVFRREHQTMN
jgi:hypothetical protein